LPGSRIFEEELQGKSTGKYKNNEIYNIKMIMNFLELAKQRCSIRSFIEKPIEKKKLEYILEAGRVAPSACNKQPQRIIVVQNAENIKKVQKAYRTFGSQCVFIICRDKRNELIRPFDNKCSGDLDIGIVTDHMMLAAREKGIGSVMVGLFDPGIITKEFNIPEYIQPTALLILGYPENGFLSENRHDKERKPLDETVMMEEYTLLQ
jgi:nitroreductase